jgi:hypothetical protein
MNWRENKERWRKASLDEWRSACVVRECEWRGSGRSGTHRCTTPTGVDVPITNGSAVHEADEVYHTLRGGR